ncbi:MAG TPA: nitroreductase family protein [Bacteroidota bacterium]|nr:nitroreductase family protein [Bacteroidota bacterium]
MDPIRLSAPRRSGGGSVTGALRKRRTVREIRDRKIPRPLLSDLLWAACGVNRRRGPFGIPGRTAASASNSQEIDVYVALEEGTFLYDPIRHALLPVVEDDLRRLAIGRGQSDAASLPPVRFIYVADTDRLVNTRGYREPGLLDPEVRKSYYYVDTGMIAGNVYLFAASRGLAAWFHNCDRIALPGRLKLRPDQQILFGQSVGYPARNAGSA